MKISSERRPSKSSLQFSMNPLSLWHRGKTHKCTLKLGSQTMIPKTDKKLTRRLKTMFIIAVWHPQSYWQFLSYPGILAERRRQVSENASWVIHPYSMLSFFWSSWMVLVNLMFMTMSPFRFAFMVEKTKIPQIIPLDYLMVSLRSILMLDIIVKFNVGVLDRQNLTISLKRRTIACRYLMGWFFFDLPSAIPLVMPLMHHRASHEYLLWPHLIAITRGMRIITVIKDFRIFLRYFTRSYIWHRLLRLMLIFIISVHWCVCLLYLPMVICYYRTGSFDPLYANFLNTTAFVDVPVRIRYNRALLMVLTEFYGTGFSMLKSRNVDEMLVFSAVILHGSVFMLYSTVVILKVYLIKYNSKMRYHELMDEMKKYMRHNMFPTELQNRVRHYYNYRYHKKYYKEEQGLDCLSEQLRNEINLYTCHKLVNKVNLFEGLPASVVGTVLGCLKPQVFMQNDLIIRAGDMGKCMYFIATGTVAVYSIKGVEVCHLDDGDHFGEVALLMKDCKRVATVVAIEITQVYRLDAEDFRQFIMTYLELYERVEVLASKRMHEIVLIDEVYRLSARAEHKRGELNEEIQKDQGKWGNS